MDRLQISNQKKESIIDKIRGLLVDKKSQKNDLLLKLFEDGRISRDEYLALLSGEISDTINVTISTSKSAWGSADITFGDHSHTERDR